MDAEQLLAMKRSLRVLARIADAYDDNELDGEALKYWGKNYEKSNAPIEGRDQTILYTGRGGTTLLTLKDCLEAREVLRRANLMERLD